MSSSPTFCYGERLLKAQQSQQKKQGRRRCGSRGQLLDLLHREKREPESVSDPGARPFPGAVHASIRRAFDKQMTRPEVTVSQARQCLVTNCRDAFQALVTPPNL